MANDRDATSQPIEDLYSVPDILEVLDHIVQATKLMFSDCEGVSLVLWEPQTQTFSLSASSMEKQPQDTTSKNVRQQGGATRWIVDHAKPLIVDDVHNDPFSANAMLKENGFQSYVGVPLISEDKVLGVLYALFNQPRQTNQEEVSIITATAQLASLSIKKAHVLKEMTYQVTIDELTKLNRRGYFMLQAEHKFRSARSLGHSLSVILLDLDHFKNLNDTYGHLVGDWALQLVAQICKDNIRDIDLIGRYGGDEFVIALVGASADQALQMAEQLTQSVAANKIEHDQKRIPLTVSLGVASLTDQTDFNALLGDADIALYQAKRSGRNQVKAS